MTKKAVYCKEMDRRFRSGADAGRALREMGIAVYTAQTENICRACRLTAKGIFAKAYGYRWCWADQIPEQWPWRNPRACDYGDHPWSIIVIRSDGQRYVSYNEAADFNNVTRNAIAKAILGTRKGRYRTCKGYQFTTEQRYNLPGFEWPKKSEDYVGAQPKKDKVKKAKRKRALVRIDGQVYESVSEAAKVCFCSASLLVQAAQATDYGVYKRAVGCQWAYKTTFEQPGFSWPQSPSGGSK